MPILRVFVLFFLLSSCKSNHLVNTYWISVKSAPIPPRTDYYGYNGMTLHFKKDKLIGGDAFTLQKEELDLRISDKNIFLNDSLWAEIHAQYIDSLILDVNQQGRIRLVKLGADNRKPTRPPLWKHKNWVLSNDTIRRELILTDSLFFGRPNTKLCLQKDLQRNQFIDAVDQWQAFEINGNQLFVKTNHQRRGEFYRVRKYLGDSIIELESLLFPNQKSELRKVPYTSEGKRLEILKTIRNQEWKTTEIISVDTLGRGTRHWDMYYVKLKSLLKKKLSFTFSDDFTYSFKEAEKDYSNGNWRISETGKALILNKGLRPYDYIDLIDVTEDSLVIGRLGNFDPIDDSSGLMPRLYYKLVLKK